MTEPSGRVSAEERLTLAQMVETAMDGIKECSDLGEERSVIEFWLQAARAAAFEEAAKKVEESAPGSMRCRVA